MSLDHLSKIISADRLLSCPVNGLGDVDHNPGKQTFCARAWCRFIWPGRQWDLCLDSPFISCALTLYLLLSWHSCSHFRISALIQRMWGCAPWLLNLMGVFLSTRRKWCVLFIFFFFSCLKLFSFCFSESVIVRNTFGLHMKHLAKVSPSFISRRENSLKCTFLPLWAKKNLILNSNWGNLFSFLIHTILDVTDCAIS